MVSGCRTATPRTRYYALSGAIVTGVRSYRTQRAGEGRGSPNRRCVFKCAHFETDVLRGTEPWENQAWYLYPATFYYGDFPRMLPARPPIVIETITARGDRLGKGGAGGKRK